MLRYRRLFFPVFWFSLIPDRPGGPRFSDLKGHWAEKTIKDLVRLRSPRLPDKTFRPDQYTRAELAKSCRHAQPEVLVEQASRTSTTTGLKSMPAPWWKRRSSPRRKGLLPEAPSPGGSRRHAYPVGQYQAPGGRIHLEGDAFLADITKSPAFAEIELASVLASCPVTTSRNSTLPTWRPGRILPG